MPYIGDPGSAAPLGSGKAAQQALPTPPIPPTAAPPQAVQGPNQPGITPNQTPVESTPAGFRRPRGYLKINGVLAQCLGWRVSQPSHYAAGTFEAEVEPWQPPQGFGFAFWADVGSDQETTSIPDNAGGGVQLECVIGFLTDDQDTSEVPAELFSLITAQVDDIDNDLVGGKITLTGRDLTALLIDQKTSTMWPDQTSSQIAQNIADAVGLTGNITATDTPAGTYYGANYAHQARDVPYFDVLTYLADQEGFDVFVTGNTLYFGPPLADQDPNPWAVSFQTDGYGHVWSNVKTFRPHRSLTLAKGISVTVLSHNHGSNKTIKAVANRAGSKSAASSSAASSAKTQNVVIRKPGLTQAQADLLAQQQLAELSKHERTFEATIEGDEALAPNPHTRMATVIGTGTTYDGNYYFASVDWTYNAESAGFACDVKAKNHPTDSTPSTIP